MVISFSDYISESIDGKMQVLDAICHVLKVNGRPLSMSEIWNEITRLNLLTEAEFKRINNARKSGKVVGIHSGYLDTLLSRSSMNTTRSDANGKNLFRIIDTRPNVKYELVNTNETEKIESDQENKYYLLGAYDENNKDLWKQFVEEGKWYNGFALNGEDTLKDKVNKISVGANVAIKSTYTRQRTQPAMMIKARGVVTKNYGDGTQLDVEWEKDFTPFEMVRSDVGGYRATLHEVSNKEHIDLIWNSDEKDEDIRKMGFIEAAQYILKRNDNRPMTSNEVWNEAEDFVDTKGLTPWDTMNAQMILYSENSTAKGKKKNSLFRIIEGTRPYKFQLINPDLEVQPIPDEDIDLDLTKQRAFEYPEDEVIPFTHFRGVQAQEEREKTQPVSSPFIDAICILGTSGKGKSYTTELILDSINNLEYEFIIPSASTTNLLAQFSPSSKSGGYVTSRLGKLIMKAHNNPSTDYVAVFDECHKANVIEMINDELLQCISTKRNKGRRFISVEQEIADLFTGLSDFRGNLMIPNNFGFVFLSSKPDVIVKNADFFNRVNTYIMLEQPKEDEINSSYGKDSEGKIELKQPFFVLQSDPNQILNQFDESKNK